MPIYQTSFDVDAPADRVWQVLTTFNRYAEWNPQIPFARGMLAEGERIQLRLRLPNRPEISVAATLEEIRPGRRLSWRGHVGAPWLFEGYRRFEVQPVEGGQTRVTHVEDIHGLLAPLFALIMNGPVAQSHHALNEALRTHAEGTH